MAVPSSPPPHLCGRCHSALGTYRLAIGERDTTTVAVNEWGRLLAGARWRAHHPHGSDPQS